MEIGLKVEINNLTTTHTELVKKLEVVQASNEELKRQVDNLNDTIKKKEDTIIELELSVKKIENKLDKHEQYSRRNSIRASGIKESENEDIGDCVLNLFNNRMKLKPPVTAEQIDRVHRTGPAKEGTTRAVLVKFATYRTRHHVYVNKKLLKPKSTPGTSPPKSAPVFINEDLTRLRANILWKARKLKADGKIKGCWSSDGTIIILNSREKVVAVHSEKDLVEKK